MPLKAGWQLIELILLLVLSSCVPGKNAAVSPHLATASTIQETATLKPHITEIHQNRTQSTPAIADNSRTGDLSELIQGDVYISFRPAEPPFLLALGRLPASCLLKSASRPPVEILFQDRNEKQPVLRQTETKSV